MGIQIDWLAENSPIVLFTVQGDWTWDDFHEAMTSAHAMMDSSPYEYVDSIVDMREGQTLPSNILSRMQGVSQNRHPKSRAMVVVGAGRFAQMMFGIMEKITPDSMRSVSLVQTFEEAEALLQAKNGRV